MTNLFKSLRESKAAEDPRGGYDFKKPSMAVIAQSGDDAAVVMWACGGHINSEIEDLCNCWDAEELGIAAAGPGIWIWEGTYQWYPGGWECPDDGSYEPVGQHRQPTEAEWESIRAGECPWNPEDWLCRKD